MHIKLSNNCSLVSYWLKMKYLRALNGINIALLTFWLIMLTLNMPDDATF